MAIDGWGVAKAIGIFVLIIIILFVIVPFVVLVVGMLFAISAMNHHNEPAKVPGATSIKQ